MKNLYPLPLVPPTLPGVLSSLERLGGRVDLMGLTVLQDAPRADERVARELAL